MGTPYAFDPPPDYILFLEDVGIGTTVLYTSAGLAFGKIVSRDWAIDLARAYNNWLYDTYVSKSPRFKAMGLIPLQEPAEAVIELRRIVRDRHHRGYGAAENIERWPSVQAGERDHIFPYQDEADAVFALITATGRPSDVNVSFPSTPVIVKRSPRMLTVSTPAGISMAIDSTPVGATAFVPL